MYRSLEKEQQTREKVGKEQTTTQLKTIQANLTNAKLETRLKNMGDCAKRIYEHWAHRHGALDWDNSWCALLRELFHLSAFVCSVSFASMESLDTVNLHPERPFLSFPC